MKKILSLLGAITLIGTSSTSLVACNKNEYTAEELKELKEKNKINTKDKTIRDNLEWIAPQEKAFNDYNGKYFYIIWKGTDDNLWTLTTYKNLSSSDKNGLIDKSYTGSGLHRLKDDIFIMNKNSSIVWGLDNNYHKYFKSVYRWNLNTKEPDLILDKDGNLKVNGE